jgi:hypothetical protein
VDSSSLAPFDVQTFAGYRKHRFDPIRTRVVPERKQAFNVR